MSNDALSQAIVRLFETERFYAELIAKMKRVSTDRVPVAGVRVMDGIELFINHKTFDAMSIAERAAVLKHECEHILRDHIGRSKELAPDVYKDKQDMAESIINSQKHKCLNIAADIAINSGISGLPEGAVYAQHFKLPDGMTLEEYFEKLKTNEEMQNYTGFDNHELWSESEGDKEMIKERVRQAVNEAAKKAREAGRMSAEHELLVANLNNSKINWQSILKRFISRSIEFSLDTSRKKRNRRYGIMFPGNVRAEEMLHIGVAIDTSGSVPDDAIKQFMTEIAKIAKYAKVTVVEADTEIKNAYEFKPKKSYNVKGRGGTAYKPAFDYFNEQSVDAMIYFGDMDNYDQEALVKPVYPVLWAIFGSQKPPAEFGSQVKVELT